MHLPPHGRAETTILVVAGRSRGVGGRREKWIPGTGAPTLEGLRHSYDGGGAGGQGGGTIRYLTQSYLDTGSYLGGCAHRENQ